MNEPIIKALPTAEQFLKLVDELVGPETMTNESQARAFITSILTVANPEDDYSWHLATTAARHAFAKTQAFEDAFREYAGFPERPMLPVDRMVISAAAEM